ncbi:isocitrate lyase/phosphoenolpyruvate mutase family protein [Microbulbifer sp. ANSA001]|uniref:isocitrate lyase/PEP mutase family protein n=1 Tax=Microbulbifer sp. ANSA001 TaxID=3243358 RepID=UPI004043114F
METTDSEQFNALHQSCQPLILPNIWDAASAQLCQAAGARAIATSSAALAWSLGYADGGKLPLAEHLGAIKRILRVSRVPVSIDLEDGYSDNPTQVAELVRTLSKLGVAGINIEDGNKNPQLLCEKITAIRSILQKRPFFINARTDIYLNEEDNNEDSLVEVTQRLTRYQTAGANGGFIPGLTSLEDAHYLTKNISMPLNLMLLPGMETPLQYWKAGIHRLSSGPELFLSSYNLFYQLSGNLVKSYSPIGMFDHHLDYNHLNDEAMKL